MPSLDIAKDAIVEFSRIQNWMLSAKKMEMKKHII